MIDLHTHTTASDGTDTPAELIAKAESAGIDVLAITDHDTLAGSDEARDRGKVKLIPAVELSVHGAHLLGYFFQDPPEWFRPWLESLKSKRRARNAAIAENLRREGMDIHLEEAEAIGRNITGRAHFARLLLDKGYVSGWEEAFSRYLGEDASCYVERDDPSPAAGIERLREAGAVVSLAHPCRVKDTERRIAEWVRDGLQALEVQHSDHTAAETARFMGLAARYGLGMTAGSDYHGLNKPEVRLGTGREGNVRAEQVLIDDLHRLSVHG